MEKGRYIVVMGWMMTSLGLNGNDLLAYALIYGYSQDSEGCYFGSLSHTAERLNISRRATADVLARLVDKGRLVKKQVVIDGIQRCMYKAVVPKEVTPQGEAPKPKDRPVKPFSKPTREEVRQYCAERGGKVDADRFYDFYETNGWRQGKDKKIRDWRAAVRTWESKNNNYNHNNSSHGQKADKESVLARRRDETVREVAMLDADYRARKAGGLETERVPDAP